jgi:cell pole-organizing protein PopZ
MGKPETKPAQSLEEILASIRKALAEEEVQGAADRLDLPERAPAAEARPAPAKGDALPGQLTVALNGSGAREPAVDDDLAELLAPLPAKEPIREPVKEPAKEPSAPAASASPSAPATSEKKDPLWFLARQPGAKSEPVLEEKPEEPPEEEEAPAAPSDEVALTRLETLRAALPPLFGSGEGAATKTEPAALAQPAALKPVELPDFPRLQKPKEEVRESKAPPPEKAPVALEVQPEPVVQPAPAPAPPPPAAVAPPPAPAPEPPAVEAAAPVSPEPRRTAMPSAQSRVLEDMIGQLIEPVIRNWLDTNLASLVEKVVREEVARAGGAKPDAPKKD